MEDKMYFNLMFITLSVQHKQVVVKDSHLALMC